MQEVHKRMLGAYCLMLLMITVAIFRIYQINMSPYAAKVTQVQGKYSLSVASARGMIYDRNMQGFVNQEARYIASVLPTPQAMDAVLQITPEESREGILSRFQSGTPFAMEVPDFSVYASGIDVFRIPVRYGRNQLAPHLIGYLGDGAREGVAGIEKAYNELLKAYAAIWRPCIRWTPWAMC
jgi:penicillin-binding protein 2